MQSQARLAGLVGREGVRGTQEKEVATVEMDATFARRLGIGEGTKVRLLISGSMSECGWMKSSD